MSENLCHTNIHTILNPQHRSQIGSKTVDREIERHNPVGKCPTAHNAEVKSCATQTTP